MVWDSYRRVLGRPGALAFSSSGLVARLPISMVSLGIVLLVSNRTGSYALAGSVSAAFLVANAAVAVPLSRLVDRYGQSRVLLPAVTGFSIGLAAMMVTVEQSLDFPLPHVCAALSGACLPQTGSAVRARWSLLLSDKRELRTAFAVEAVADEMVFIIGPALVATLSTAVHPLAGLGCAVLAALAGTAVLTSLRETEPPPSPRVLDGPPPTPMPWRVMAPLTVACFTLGVAFGAVEVATVAFAEELGHPAAAGLLLALYALGSLVAGLVVGAVHLETSNAIRFRWSMLALALLVAPLPLVGSLLVMGVLLVLAGVAISPTLISAVAWVEESVPPGRMTEGISLTTTGLVFGVAPGAALAGVMVDAYGASGGYLVPVLAGLVGATVAFTTRPRPTRPTRADSSPNGSRG